ncbi:hypothetical protein RMS29_027670 (plasmid) [Agrobacterium rosae]|uniref:Uncharacterized protein n=1 Tax=Agrobacterium rosae TaxID=1972867 RepID=A0ABU4W3R7_9HYPH|nr:hypothetical protein [Agrobacterium rosae]MDX8316288.1 hypothetical protein [Agrobacterium rosae]MDX8332405.1 hypothetical protein [Agrobacterium rosae]
MVKLLCLEAKFWHAQCSPLATAKVKAGWQKHSMTGTTSTFADYLEVISLKNL